MLRPVHIAHARTLVPLVFLLSLSACSTPTPRLAPSSHGVTRGIPADCNGDPSDGLETDLDSDPENCRACGLSCFGAACVEGVCQIARWPRGLDGAEPNGPSWSVRLSANGRNVLFVSGASNLVEDDLNQAYDVFVVDRQTGQTRRISVGSDGHEANGDSADATFSADGSRVRFWSTASNLVEGSGSEPPCLLKDEKPDEAHPDNCHEYLQYEHDLVTGSTQIALDPDSVPLPDDHAQLRRVRDGELSVESSHYVSSTGRVYYVHVTDCRGPGAEVSRSAAGFDGNDISFAPTFSADGRFVAFSSMATNLVDGDDNAFADLFVVGTPKSSDELIADARRRRGNAPPASAVVPVLSEACRPCDDGRCCGDCATDLQTDPRNCGGCGFSCFGAACVDGVCAMSRISLAPNGEQTNGPSGGAKMSTDGRFVLFYSKAKVFDPTLPCSGGDFWLDRSTGKLLPIKDVDGRFPDHFPDFKALSADGRTLALSTQVPRLSQDDDDDESDVLVCDLPSGSCSRIDQNPINTGPRCITSVSLSANGQKIAFHTNEHLYLHDRASATYTLAGVASDGSPIRPATMGSLSADAQVVCFTDFYRDRKTGQAFDQISVHDFASGSTEAIARGGYRESLKCHVSADGRSVLVSGENLTVYDRASGVTEPVCVTPDGQLADAPCHGWSLSADGRFVAFDSEASNLCADSEAGVFGVYVRDRVRGLTLRLDRRLDGSFAGGTSRVGMISADGHLVSFTSPDPTILPDDDNGVDDVFVVGVPQEGASPIAPSSAP